VTILTAHAYEAIGAKTNATLWQSDERFCNKANFAFIVLPAQKIPESAAGSVTA
jgi:hypothetical protein